MSPGASGATVVTGLHDPSSLVWGADLVGLAAALADTLDVPTFMAVADGDEMRPVGPGNPVHFPAPVGTRTAHPVPSPHPSVQLLRAPALDEWSALRVTGERTLAMVDDGRFASAVILAAAALLPEGPVWENSRRFLAEVRRLGLRFAQAVVR